MKYLLIIFTFISSCATTSTQSNDILQLITLSKGNGSGSEGFEQGNFIIKNVNQLKSYGRLANFDNNSIDFSREIVLIAIDKIRNSGGYGIEISNAKIVDNKVLVSIDYSSPKLNDMVTMALTQPYHVVKMKRTDKEIVFINAK